MPYRLADAPPATHVLRPEKKDSDLGFLEAVARKISGGLLQLAGGQNRGGAVFYRKLAIMVKTLNRGRMKI